MEDFFSAEPFYLAIGNFDGVHLAHQSLIAHCVNEARTDGCLAYALTFEPHPNEILHKNQHFFRLMPPQKKMDALQSLGLDGVLVAQFDQKFSELSAKDFCLLLQERGCLQKIFVGFDFRFGQKASGTSAFLQSFFQKRVKIQVLEEQSTNAGKISSSHLRQLIREGQIEKYKTLTGRCYSLGGRVEKGEGKGHLLGFPTANIAHQSPLLEGVYSGFCLFGNQTLKALIHLGPAPTMERKKSLLEVHIPDFTGDLYGVELEVFFERRIRGIVQFASMEELKNRIQKDLQCLREA